MRDHSASESDPRLTPARPDLAASWLEGSVKAARYVEGEVCEIRVPEAPLRRTPDLQTFVDTHALYGERITIYDRAEGWAWGQLAGDGYVGYLPEDAVRKPRAAPTHKVCVPATYLFPEKQIKSTPVARLSMLSELVVEDIEGAFARTPEGYVMTHHLHERESCERDYVEVALRFLETPYLWGGKSSYGIDCSGLVQIALKACGIACPRDSDMQEKALGTRVTDGGFSRGDLLFWKGHVGIISAPNRLLHANAFHMRVAEEDVHQALSRIESKGVALLSHARMTD